MNVGESVTIKVKNQLYDKRNCYAFPIAEFAEYTGTILPSPRWVDNTQLCLSTGIAGFPFRVIAKADILGLSNKVASKTDLQTVWTIPGSKAGTVYIVTRQGTSWSCNCLGYGFKRTCSHVRIAKEEFQGEKKVLPSEKSACYSIKSGVSYMGKIEKGTSSPLNNGEVKMSKRNQAIEIMNVNADKDMATVVKLIAKKIDVTEANAKSYYRYIVTNKLGAGNIDKPAKVAKVKKVSKTALLEKSVDEITAIKAKNLQTMKIATLKGHGKEATLPAGRLARPQSEGVADFDPQLAREEVQAILNDEGLDAYSPKFLRGRQ
jgi:hypothetical protein